MCSSCTRGGGPGQRRQPSSEALSRGEFGRGGTWDGRTHSRGATLAALPAGAAISGLPPAGTPVANSDCFSASIDICGDALDAGFWVGRRWSGCRGAVACDTGDQAPATTFGHLGDRRKK
eukprot:354629-Chlamydomonas_euryale.AAC.8